MTTPPHLSPAVSAGRLLYLSGQLAFGPDGVLIDGDIAAQTARTLDNIAAVLDQHGLTLAHVVKATVWLARVEDFAPFNAAYAAAFGTHRPARSTVRSDLMLPGALVEIEVIADTGRPS